MTLSSDPCSVGSLYPPHNFFDFLCSGEYVLTGFSAAVGCLVCDAALSLTSVVMVCSSISMLSLIQHTAFLVWYFHRGLSVDGKSGFPHRKKNTQQKQTNKTITKQNTKIEDRHHCVQKHLTTHPDSQKFYTEWYFLLSHYGTHILNPSVSLIAPCFIAYFQTPEFRLISYAEQFSRSSVTIILPLSLHEKM